MRDIPMFTTENGIGSLIFKEIPYSATAYVRIQDSLSPEAFLQDCISFCRAVGAERIYAAGHQILEQYPLHTAVWEMSCFMGSLADTDAALFPVTESTLSQWQQIYNDGMKNVANASYMTQTDAKQMLQQGDGYFVHRGDILLGIGKASGETIDAVVSVVPGTGHDIVCALAHALFGERIRLQVASTNNRAIRLYEKLGFIKTAEISKWYKIF